MKLAKLDNRYLLSAKSLLIQAESLEDAIRCLVPAYDAEPERTHNAMCDLVLAITRDITAELRASPLPEKHELKIRAKEARQQAAQILGRMSDHKDADIKHIAKPTTTTKGGVKVKPMEVPEFSGQTEDWLSFFRLFKSAIHDNPDLETSTKLHHLIQALQDPVQKSMYAERMDETNAYQKFIDELTQKYDKPRWMHRRYCQNMKDLTTNQHTREGLTQLVSQVTKIQNGFIRLKATDSKQILTSITESIMDIKLRELWYHRQLPLQEATKVRSLPHIQDLYLADEQFDQPGKIELLLGQDICRQLFLSEVKRGSTKEPEAWLTVFGWTVTGAYSVNNKSASQIAITHAASAEPESEVTLDVSLKRFWEIEEAPAPEKKKLAKSEELVEQHFADTHSYIESRKRYMVRLPRVNEKLTLGESKTLAVKRAKGNEKSLIRKDKLEAFQTVMQEYVDLGHAQKVTEKMGVAPDSYYMPIHSVFKESSSSTKLRAVFDASAKTTNGNSLNDMLAVGPTLHQTLDHILLNFRGYAVAITGDISKMYREVLLHPLDRALHRYIWKKSNEEAWSAYQMTRVTFGVTASPYLAVKVLQQVAEDFGSEMTKAKWHLLNSFYVDDLMGGAATEEEVIKLYNDLNYILQQASFTLRKWRSSSSKVLSQIPEDMQEKLPVQDLVDLHSASYPKALGVTWNSRDDSMSISTNIAKEYVASKRGIISDVARTFDVLGWVSPVVLPMKILYKEVWKTGVDWDAEIKEEQEARHRKWREELHFLSEIKIPRHYFSGQVPVKVELHGYSDASEEAFGAVIYIRAIYNYGPPSSALVISKTRVTPPKTRTIPQLEMCGAHLLAVLMTSTRQTLKVPLENCYGNSDSTTVLSWIDQSPHKYRIYVANRLAQTTTMLPAEAWRFVPTKHNPADVATRGATVEELKNHDLWWHGPHWLMTEPIIYSEQPKEEIYKRLRSTELRSKEVPVHIVAREECLEDKFKSYKKLLRVVCRVKRLGHFGRTKVKVKEENLTAAEARIASNILISRSQWRSFPDELKKMCSDPPGEISQKSRILTLRPKVDKKGILRVGGRFDHADLPEHTKHPIILSGSDHFTSLLFLHYHVQLGHCGPSLLLAHSGNIFHIKGGKRLARAICNKCVICRKTSAKASSQLLGQLPSARIEPNFVFLHTGLDMAGPYFIRKGHTRRPVVVKCYLIIFVCFCTKAVHLELVSDATKESFIASLERFTSRRSTPLHLYSDHGPNFMGARNELLKYYKMINSTQWQESIQSYAFEYEITWHTIPQAAPHFGGLWEAAMKSAKYHLRKIVAGFKFTFEELYTIMCKVESYLRPPNGTKRLKISRLEI